jgi:hypothetical protein
MTVTAGTRATAGTLPTAGIQR